MIDPEPNITTHDWYQNRYHTKLPVVAESKSFLDAAYIEGSADPNAATWLGQQATWLGPDATWTAP